ncbi:MAG TPA: Hsp20 family protein [Parvibaculum sp.]|jgi:molecular chaperone IbpA
MRTFDFSPLYRSTVGFDQLHSLLESVTREAGSPTYPPYNIERLGESDYRISMAVAGFAESDLAIEVKQNVLTISGKRAEPENVNYLHQGIAGRSFERRFQLADHVEVKGATLVNGLLHVDLVRQIPEQLKPRQISIETAPKAKAIEGTLAAAE